MYNRNILLTLTCLRLRDWEVVQRLQQRGRRACFKNVAVMCTMKGKRPDCRSTDNDRQNTAMILPRICESNTCGR
jgi:hypothetical protein